MLKKSFPYLLAIFLGIIFGYYMFDGEINLSNILNKSNYVGFQIGVYNDLQSAEKIKNIRVLNSDIFKRSQTACLLPAFSFWSSYTRI